MINPKNTSYTVDYFFTITLRPKCYKHEPELQYDLTFSEVKNKLSSLSQAFTLIAEVTKAYNIHYHGLIKFIYKDPKKDYMKEFCKTFRNHETIGFVKIDQVRDISNTIIYMSKEFDKTSNAIHRRPIINDFFNLFEEDHDMFGTTW